MSFLPERIEKMSVFAITVRTELGRSIYFAIAKTSYEAFVAAAEAQGNSPCAITVTPA